MGCVYVATNKVNGKQYVGKTIFNFENRKLRHARSALADTSFKFHSAIRKHGLDSFDWMIVFESLNENELFEAEKRWIKHLNTFSDGYNMTFGGEGTSGLVRSFTEKRNENVSKSLKGRKLSSSHKESISKNHPRKNKHLSNEHKEKIRISNIGKKRSKAQRINTSIGSYASHSAKRISKSINVRYEDAFRLIKHMHLIAKEQLNTN